MSNLRSSSVSVGQEYIKEGINDKIAILFSRIKSRFSGKSVVRSLKSAGITAISIVIFIALWHVGAQALFQKEAQALIDAAYVDRGEAAAQAVIDCIQSGDISCQPNSLPGPAQVYQSAMTLYLDHLSLREARDQFYLENAEINAQLSAAGKPTLVYTGRSSFIDRIVKSLLTVFAGCVLAMLIAIPTGILVGLNEKLRQALNWFIQIFKPVSPVVWFLLVYMVVKTLSQGSSMDKSFIISMFSVGLCSMWATLVNTSVGVSSVDRDYLNVANVLQLGFFKRIFKIILPSSLPMIFTGLRITVSVAWMVLIAIELLAQSPGLGSFVWEEFQNGANDSNAKIIVAMFVIGIIGFALDRIMLTLQRSMSFTK